MFDVQRENASSPSAVNPELLTNSPRDQAALPDTFPENVVKSAKANLRAVPFGLHQIGVTLQPEATIDLLSDDPKRAARRKPEPSKHFVEEALEPEPPVLGTKLGDLNQKRREFLRLCPQSASSPFVRKAPPSSTDQSC